MPLMPDPVRVDATDTGFACDLPRLGQALSNLAPEAPIVIMIHGYRFAPGFGRHCPHQHILSANPDPTDRSAISWPRHLGLNGQDGLSIAFGWQARGLLPLVHRRARSAGESLAQFVQHLPEGRAVNIIAHSLGARVALSSLHFLHPGRVNRLILLAAAETRAPAARAMASPAGKRAEVYNITTRENDLFDVCLEWLATAGCDTAIGEGLATTLPNWIDLQIDHKASLAALSRIGFAVPTPPARISHWSPYQRPGLFPLYRAILDGELSVPSLRTVLPAHRDARWARLRPSSFGWRAATPAA